MQQKLSQIQTQKLILSPQIRQYLKLLQLPIYQLEPVLEQEISDNPALEEISSPDDEPSTTEEQESQKPQSESSNNEDVPELNFYENLKKLDELDENFKNTLYTDFSKNNERTPEQDERQTYQQSLITQSQNLTDYLLFQMHLLNLNEEEVKIATEIIGNINEDGYLTVPLEEIAAYLEKPTSEVEKVLQDLQTLDPPGTFARNLKECLSLQIKRKFPDNKLAQSIIEDHLALLEKRDYIKLSKKLKTSIDRIKNVSQLISHLEPKPGRIFFREESISVIPDANVYRDDDTGELIIEMNEDPIPRIRINSEFRKMLKDKNLDSKAKEFIKEKVNSAIWLIRALDQRQSTLKEITKKIVQSQSDFFDRGFASLKPLRLKDISQSLNIHESTVSRAISGKYLRTPIGTIPYKSFFSNKMEALVGEESQKSVMEKIRTLVQRENPSKPLSDEKIVELLQAEGVKVARRTAAKYRGLLKILPSYLRKNH